MNSTDKELEERKIVALEAQVKLLQEQNQILKEGNDIAYWNSDEGRRLKREQEYIKNHW